MEVGWIAAIIVGGIAGWLAEQFMKSQMGLLMNIILGIVGAAVAKLVVRTDGSEVRPWLGWLLVCRLHRCSHPHLCRALDSTTRVIECD
jgi:uncharacterized membrane protein YeaQ/YmgE (transglycosylase-associated protein family)